MKTLFLLLLATLPAFTFAQEELFSTCSKKTKHSNSQLKSASLSVAQIAETEKYDVHFYGLNIAMNNVVTTVAGTGEIHASAKVPLDSALFELFSTFTISQIRVNGNPVNYSRVGSAIKVPVNAVATEQFIIAVDYSGTPPTAQSNPLGGSGMTNASSPSWGNRVTWSLSEPFSAYEWWPCKQSLTDKADSCAVKITVPDSCKAGSNGVLENVVDLGNGFSRYEWKHRHAIDYYLVSVAVAKYVEYNVFANPVGAPAPILIQNYIYDNPQTLINFQNEIDETVDFMELFYALFGPYRFEDEKYGHCMAPISGGMEHQTMTTQGFFEKNLTAHELAHQWFGDNVTCASWSDIWVNEGFASYGEYLMLENLYVGQQVAKMADVHDNVMSQLGGSVWVLDSLNEGQIFSSRLTYDKGAAIVHQLRYLVNNDAQFFDILQDFQLDFGDSTAKGVDVKESFESSTGLDLTSYFEQWYFGQGYPTYSLKWNEIGDDILIKLTHTASVPGVTPTFTNPISVRIVRVGAADTIVRLNVTANEDWYVLTNAGNANSMQIDPANWIVNKVGTVQFDASLVDLGELSTVQTIVYPNPTSDIVTIKTSKVGKLNYVLYQMNGQIAKTGSVSSNESIDLKMLQQGNYLLEIDGERKLIEKIN
ncbi:MAG: M1 family aminopeptidase [Bacteroidota bacterium]